MWTFFFRLVMSSLDLFVHHLCISALVVVLPNTGNSLLVIRNPAWYTAFVISNIFFNPFSNLSIVVGALPISPQWTLLTVISTARFRYQRGRSISVLSEKYETSYLFYVTLSFLCNIICYLISVFVFSLVILSGATTSICLIFPRFQFTLII